MITALIAATLVVQVTADERQALFNQAADRLADKFGEMTYSVGLCASRYPLAQSDPYVLTARRDAAGLGLGVVDLALARIEGTTYAQGVADAPTTPTTIAGCAELLSETGQAVSEAVDGLESVFIHFGQSSRISE